MCVVSFAFLTCHVVSKLAETGEVSAPHGHTWLSGRKRYLKDTFSGVKESIDASVRKKIMKAQFSNLRGLLAPPESTPPC